MYTKNKLDVGLSLSLIAECCCAFWDECWCGKGKSLDITTATTHLAAAGLRKTGMKFLYRKRTSRERESISIILILHVSFVPLNVYKCAML